jgi:hypothetical protein
VNKGIHVPTVAQPLCTTATIMCMTEPDAIDTIHQALTHLNALDHQRHQALHHLQTAVRRAHQQGYPKTALARHANCHRNTIHTWCTEPDN